MPVIMAGEVGEFASSTATLAASVGFAKPKSSTFTFPSLVSAIFAGFKSR